ncbi:MAG: (p)ppGpp synthetase [Treponema sp.]|nr:(p)ppGpp synthetase [Treponema sp.]
MNSKYLSKSTIRENYEAYGEYFAKILQNILVVLQDKIHLSAQPTYKWRIKRFDSYYKKVLRKEADKITEFSSLICLTDMLGIRLICAFLEDINLAISQIKELFEIKEVEVKGTEKNFSEFGYESIHVLVKIPEECFPPKDERFENLMPLGGELVCEIQIRTILQDAWAEVEHELIYKTEFSPFDAPLRRKLAAINASLSLADITFQEIRDYQKKLQKELEERRQSFYSIADNLLDEKPKQALTDEPINRVSPFVQGTIDEMLLRAIEAHNAGNLEGAVQIYSKILDSIPATEKTVISVIRKHRGMAFFSMNKLEDALEDFNTSIECDPKAFRTHYYKGIVLSIQKKYQEAIDSFTTSLEINEFQAHTHFRRALAYYEVNEFENSMNDLDAAIKLGMKQEEYKFLQEKLVQKFGMNM